MRSLKRLLALNPSILYPGHGPVAADAVGTIRQYINHRESRENQVRSLSLLSQFFLGGQGGNSSPPQSGFAPQDGLRLIQHRTVSIQG